MKLTLILVAGLALAALGFTVAPLAVHAQGSVYVVQAGDTASGIAARHCMSLQELASLNGWDMTQINQIYPGMPVQVVNRCGGNWGGGNGGGNWNCGGWNCGNCNWGGGYDRGARQHAQGYLHGNTYFVVRGDTAFSIAQRFGISVNALAQANGINPWHIYAGQRLTIPAYGGGNCQPPPCYGNGGWCQPQPCYPHGGYGCQPNYGQPPIYTIPVTPTP